MRPRTNKYTRPGDTVVDSTGITHVVIDTDAYWIWSHCLVRGMPPDWRVRDVAPTCVLCIAKRIQLGTY